MHSTQKVNAPFEQRVLYHTLNAGIFNPKRVVTITPFCLFTCHFLSNGTIYRYGVHKKGKCFRKTPIPGEFLGSYREMTPKHGNAGIPVPKILSLFPPFVFERLTHSYIISAPPGSSFKGTHGDRHGWARWRSFPDLILIFADSLIIF